MSECNDRRAERNRRVVPCNGCRACCHDAVWLLERWGDVPAEYDHVIDGWGAPALRRREDGSCVYLGSGGCTIWSRAPFLCRRFDCRSFYLRLTQEQREAALRRSANAEIFAAARRLLGE